MRLIVLVLILIVTLFGSGFWYDYIDTSCKVPLKYKIGVIDARFGTNATELKRIIERAEKIWEDGLSKDLFVYSEDAKIPINLIFDERQENANSEQELREDLESRAGMSSNVAVQYEKLITEFRLQKKQYEARTLVYESKLTSYNNEVNDWNQKGGAPPKVISELNKSKDSLENEFASLQTLSKKLNEIVVELNNIGAKGNLIVADYNSVVQKYNTEFGTGHEFTQGDYTQRDINIYQFDSEDELVIVLAHEFGHALSLNHVENEKSIMYHFMKEQDIRKGLTQEDMDEFIAMCEHEKDITYYFNQILSRF